MPSKRFKKIKEKTKEVQTKKEKKQAHHDDEGLGVKNSDDDDGLGVKNSEKY